MRRDIPVEEECDEAEREAREEELELPARELPERQRDARGERHLPKQE
jgi:hypothetical protein